MKRKRTRKHTHYEECMQNEDFYFIAGYTSSGAPFGTTWEEAYRDGLVDEEHREIKVEMNPDDLPF